jgi:hypothetical protein
MKMRQALISIARIAVSPYPRYSESMPLFSHQETTMSTTKWWRCPCLFVLLLLEITRYCSASWAFAQAAPIDQTLPRMVEQNIFAPFVELAPSQDGRELLIHVNGVDDPAGAIYASVGLFGPTHDKRGYALVYWDTVEAYVTTALGFTPETSASGSLNITTTSGLEAGEIEFSRFYLSAASQQALRSPDGNLELGIVTTDTIPFATYVVVAPSYAPPGAIPSGQRVIGNVYSVRAAGALVQTEKPMNLRIYYTEQLLQGADPHTLALFGWNAAARQWVDLGGRLFDQQEYNTTAIRRFGVYALMHTPSWRDELDDFAGLDFAQINNVTWGGELGARALVLANTPGDGHVVSQPMTATLGFARWGTLVFSATASPPTSTLTVDVLGLDGSLLVANLASGSSLAVIDPLVHPSLRLRANLAATAAGQSPRLDAWRVSWQAPNINKRQVYLPLVQGE